MWVSEIPALSPRGALGAEAAGEVVVVDYTGPPYDALPNPHGLRELLLAPMRVGGEVVGLLNIDFGAAAHPYSSAELRLVGAVLARTGVDGVGGGGGEDEAECAVAGDQWRDVVLDPGVIADRALVVG